MKAMTLRELLRGGYQHITEPTLITKRGRPFAIWMPPGTNFTLTAPSYLTPPWPVTSKEK